MNYYIRYCKKCKRAYDYSECPYCNTLFKEKVSSLETPGRLDLVFLASGGMEHPTTNIKTEVEEDGLE